MPVSPPFYVSYPPAIERSSILPAHLRHRYFVKLTPDGTHLVPGVLHQGLPPNNGNWLEVGKIDRDLASRYFVKVSNNRTAVPGSLVEAQTMPAGRWKEIKRKSPIFHRFDVITGNYWVFMNFGFATITTVSAFNSSKALPVLMEAFPNANLPATPLTYKLFYFLGDFAQLNFDPQKMTLFSDSSHLRLSSTVNGVTTFRNTIRTDDVSDSVFQIFGGAPIGYYSIILGKVNPDNQITEYVVLANLINHYIPL